MDYRKSNRHHHYHSHSNTHPYHTHRHHRNPKSIEEHIQKSDHLLSKDEFLRIARPNDSDTDAVFAEYVRRHQREFLIRFTREHGSDPWLQCLYPSGSQEHVDDRAVEERVKWFCENILTKKDEISLTFDEEVLGSGRREGRMYFLADRTEFPLMHDSSKRQLYINNIPPNALSTDLLQVIQSICPHAQSIAMSNPVPSKGFTRSAWLTLADQANNEVRLLDGMLFNGNRLSVYPKDPAKKIKLISGAFSHPDRIKKDLFISQELITSLNVEQKIAFDLDSFHKVADDRQRLDLQIMFLRTVHWVCYYSSYEAACPEELTRHCGDMAMREAASTESTSPFDEIVFDKKIQLLIDRGYRTLNLAPIALDERLAVLFVEKMDEEKYKCRECGKLFKGPEFVVKHLQLKHNDSVVEEQRQSLVLVNRILELPHFLLLPASLTVRPGYSRRPSLHEHHHGAHRHAHRPATHQRPLREYVDLDAPAVGSIDISYDLQ